MVNQLDPMNVFTLGLAAAFGSQLAEVIGPYSVIFILAAAGAGWSIDSSKRMSIVEAVMYFMLVMITAVFLTFYITQGIMVVFDDTFHAHVTPPNWLMGSIAFGIGCVGTRWRSLGNWITSFIRAKLIKLFKDT